MKGYVALDVVLKNWHERTEEYCANCGGHFRPVFFNAGPELLREEDTVKRFAL